MRKQNHLFDIDNPDFYEFGKAELKERTRQRLNEIADCGMEEVGDGQFGYKNVMSGLYIERVWSYSDEEFKDYMDWAKNLILEKNHKELKFDKNTGKNYTSEIVDCDCTCHLPNRIEMHVMPCCENGKKEIRQYI